MTYYFCIPVDCSKLSLLAVIVSYGSNNGSHLSRADTSRHRNCRSHRSTRRDAVNKTPRTPSNQQKQERKSTTSLENEAPLHESQWLPLVSSSSENIDELRGRREGIKRLVAPGRQRNVTIREGSDKHRGLWRHQSMVQLLARQRRIVLPPTTPWCQLEVGVADTLE